MPLSASIFRRGGPKKELFDAINEDGDDEKELDEKLAELQELLHTDKTGREVSAAIWRPALCAAEVIKQRKQCARDMGFIRGRKIYLHVEEAVYLLDRGDLLLFVEEADEQQQQQRQGVQERGREGLAPQAQQQQQEEGGEQLQAAGEREGYGGGWRRRQRQRLLSVQEAFDLMISVGVPLERYLLYGALSRSGFWVMRHPSRWLLGREEQPEQVWGSGAWAACYGRTPAVPGAVPPQPTQQQLAAARAAAAAATAAAAPAMTPPEPASNAADVAAAASPAAAPMEVEARDATAGATTTAAVTGRQQGAAATQHRRRQGPGEGSGGAAAAAVVVGARGWWQAAGPGHPHFQGVPEEVFTGTPPVVVEERLVHSLRATFPNLRPLNTIASALATPAPPLEAAAAAMTLRTSVAASCGKAGAADAAAAGQATEAEAEAWASTAAAGGGGGGVSSSSSGSIDLGTPSEHAHLVFDVYKPGSFVSRYKGQFPAVHTHVAMCSAAPPTLGEMRAADAAAAGVAVGLGGGGGDTGRPVSVSWVAVLNGDIALYSIGEANLLQLL